MKSFTTVGLLLLTTFVVAAGVGLGLWPALFSVAMLSTYTIVMGMVYSALEPR